MSPRNISNILTYCIAGVWMVNGLVCKVLNQTPRHQQIVTRILNPNSPRTLTILIGLAEMFMSVWIVSGVRPKLNTWMQIVVILTMNVLEFTFAPDLLLWGRLNLLFALLFVFLIYFNEYRFKRP